MKELIIAVAQIRSEKGEIESNITSHLRVMDIAGSMNISLLVFPELSLTGYEPELASSLAITAEDPRLKELAVSAAKNNAWVMVGAPLRNGANIEVGAIVFSPFGDISTYSKMYLHPGEEKCFTASRTPKIIEIHNQKIGLAICADTDNQEHVAYYAKQGVSAYVAGVLISAGGYTPDTEKMKAYAKQHNILVAIANHNHPTGGWSPIGKSASWSGEGLLSVGSEDTDCMVVSRELNGLWEAETIAI